MKKTLLWIITFFLVLLLHDFVTQHVGLFVLAEPQANYEQLYNITLWVRDWENKTSIKNVKVTIYDLHERIFTSRMTNETGHADVPFVKAGTYIVTIDNGNRTLGRQKIIVTQDETFVINTWCYNLRINLVGSDNTPLANHTVLLYDQVARVPVKVAVANGIQRVFNLGYQNIFRGTEKIYLNGSLTTNYNIDYDDGEIIFNNPPANNTIISAYYTYLQDANDDIGLFESYMIETEREGRLIGQVETDEKGAACFTGLWNGTYRVKIVGKGVWIEEYLLGELIKKYLEPATGEFIINISEPTNLTLRCARADIRFKVVSNSGQPISNATLILRTFSGHMILLDKTNGTGNVEKRNIYVSDETYTVSIIHENRLVGKEYISLMDSKVFEIRCWTYNLTVTCVDMDGKPLDDHPVFLFDKMTFTSPTVYTILTGETGPLRSYTKTDSSGKAYFVDIWNGTYLLKVYAEEVIAARVVDIQNPISLIIVCNKTFFALTFTTASGEPLPNAMVTVLSGGNPIFRGYTDENGFIMRERISAGNYTVNVELAGTLVWSGTVDITKSKYQTIQCTVYRLKLTSADQSGNVIPKADLVIRRILSRTQSQFLLSAKTDEYGKFSILLPFGTYEISCSSGIYAGSLLVNPLNSDLERTVFCSIKATSWLLIIIVTIPTLILTALLERRRLRAPLAIRKYRSMLNKLEAMYNGGLVEYRIYRKLREEYETKIMELEGREVR
ncbi:MAG: T9SS type A sorting domain-containing protein [Nitrososphaerota archaeon]|nr:carboxypeptidase-like regulatory domain-containing protein [Candidatus Bathyarchaeota archaeon]MDW8049272.1 T9SS type A sorting domain-containing protein [Nitrososphaerota archaeon]